METIAYKSKFPVLDDLRTAVKVTKAVIEARKSGATGVKVQPVKTVSLIDFGYWSWTPEALLSYPKHPSGTREAVKAVFDNLDEETKHALTFAPEDFTGGLVGRAKFWQEALKSRTSPESNTAPRSSRYLIGAFGVLSGLTRKR